jgi:hypothetical protein
LDSGNPKFHGRLSFEQVILHNGRDLPHVSSDYDTISDALSIKTIMVSAGTKKQSALFEGIPSAGD